MARKQERHEEDEDWRCRVQYAGEAARYVLLAPREDRPGADTIQERLEKQRPPNACLSWEPMTLIDDDQNQDERGDGHPCRDECDRRDLRDGDLDEQVGRSPERREQEEQEELLEDAARYWFHLTPVPHEGRRDSQKSLAWQGGRMLRWRTKNARRGAVPRIKGDYIGQL